MKAPCVFKSLKTSLDERLFKYKKSIGNDKNILKKDFSMELLLLALSPVECRGIFNLLFRYVWLIGEKLTAFCYILFRKTLSFSTFTAKKKHYVY